LQLKLAAALSAANKTAEPTAAEQPSTTASTATTTATMAAPPTTTTTMTTASEEAPTDNAATTTTTATTAIREVDEDEIDAMNADEMLAIQDVVNVTRQDVAAEVRESTILPLLCCSFTLCVLFGPTVGSGTRFRGASVDDAKGDGDGRCRRHVQRYTDDEGRGRRGG
jgi:hypothetical protein